jgi:hypothetical protein
MVVKYVCYFETHTFEMVIGRVISACKARFPLVFWPDTHYLGICKFEYAPSSAATFIGQISLSNIGKYSSRLILYPLH